MKFLNQHLFGRWIIVAVACHCGLTAAEEAVVNQVGGREVITADGPRPIATAVRFLIENYGYEVTYEDPAYQSPDDLEDVTGKVRGAALAANQSTPRIVVPAGGQVSATVNTWDSMGVLEGILASQANNRRGGRFALRREGGYIHVVPQQVRDRSGNYQASVSILDTRISIEEREWKATDLIAEICKALTKALSSSGDVLVSAGVDSISHGVEQEGAPLTYSFQAAREPARSVLIRAFDAIRPNYGKLTWLLYYSTNENLYALNVLPIPKAEEEQKNEPYRGPARSNPSGSGNSTSSK